MLNLAHASKLILLILSLYLFSSLSLADTVSSAQVKKLGDGWAVSTPAAAGFDESKLKSLEQMATSGELHNIHSILIEHDGKLIYEKYFSGPDMRWGLSFGEDINFQYDTLHDIRSITKSVTSASLGIALEGKYEEALQTPVLEYFPHLKDKLGKGADQVTLKHALTMSAGLQWNEMDEPYTSFKNDEIKMSLYADPVSMVLARDAVTPPGSTWYYSGGLTQVIAGILTKLVDMPMDKYTEKVLFEPLGIKDYRWMGPRVWEYPSAASGLRLTARDVAKVGSVYLNDGKWNGKQIVPLEWIKLSTQRYIENIPWGDGFASYGYGYQWYTGKAFKNNNMRVIRAIGWGGQRLLLFPELDVGIYVLAGNYKGEGLRTNDKKIIETVLSAIK